MTTHNTFDLADLLSVTEEINCNIDVTAQNKKKLQLLHFIRVLMNLLAHENPTLHNQTMWIMEDSAIKLRMKAPGFETYESAERNLLARLQETVGQDYWNQAKHRSSTLEGS